MTDKLSERIEIVHPGDPLGNAFWRDDIGQNQRIPVPVAEALIALEQRVERQQKIIDLAKTYMGTKAWLKVGQAIASQEEEA